MYQMTNENLKYLGKRIRSIRKEQGLTQEELADIAGIDRSYIGSLERGERNITINVLCQVSRALKCDISNLTSGLPLE